VTTSYVYNDAGDLNAVTYSDRPSRFILEGEGQPAIMTEVDRSCQVVVALPEPKPSS
jgi:hypothetical protein